MNWAHLHLALNHVPVMGALFVALLLLVGVLRNSRELVRVSLWAFVLLGAASIPIKFTGDRAAQLAMSLDGINDVAMERHEAAAGKATTGAFIVGVAAAACLLGWRGKQNVPPWAAMFVLFLATVTFALMAWAANLGGQIRHPEIGSPPAQASAENQGS